MKRIVRLNDNNETERPIQSESGHLLVHLVLISQVKLQQGNFYRHLTV